MSTPPTIQTSRRVFVAATALALASAGLSVGPTAIAQSRNLQGPRITHSVPTWTARAHQKGIRIHGATLTPFEGTIFAGYFTPAGETKRQIVNNFIRTSGEYDAVIDFDAALRDPAAPTRMRAAFDVGDHLHPNDAGYQAMADAVDLSLFDTDLSLLRQEAQALQQSISEAVHLCNRLSLAGPSHCVSPRGTATSQDTSSVPGFFNAFRFLVRVSPACLEDD